MAAASGGRGEMRNQYLKGTESFSLGRGKKVLEMDGGDRLGNVSIFNATEVLFTCLVISDSLQPHRL